MTSSVFECAMVLTTAVQLNGYDGEDGHGVDSGNGDDGSHDDLYFTHPENPLTSWAADSHDNWRYLRAYVQSAHREWRYRWDHGNEERHGCWATVQTLSRETVRDLDWPSEGRTDPPQLTGAWSAADYVDAYWYYYANEKRHLFEWSRERSAPPWIDAYTVAGDVDLDAPPGDVEALPDDVDRDALPGDADREASSHRDDRDALSDDAADESAESDPT